MRFLIIDVCGYDLTDEDKFFLQHKYVAGVIIFSKNFLNKDQLVNLIGSIREFRSDLFIGVDHEGGRVQRLINGFTKIPPMSSILDYADDDLELSCHYSKNIGWLLASELLEVGIDFSFSPVLDRVGSSNVIGTRAFSDDFDNIISLASSLIEGMRSAGMASCGKHFPGHGFVTEDTHYETAVDKRSLDDIVSTDLRPFSDLIKKDYLDSVMLAHVNYIAIDDNPVCFSEFWIKEYLFKHLGFKGVVISDDLNMKALDDTPKFIDKVNTSLLAGCDLLLICHNQVAVKNVLSQQITIPDGFVNKIDLLKSDAIFNKIQNKDQLTFSKDICMSMF